MTTKLLDRDDILRANDLRCVKVDMTPYGWPGHVFVRSMTARERGQFEYDMQAVAGPVREENQKKFRARILVMTVVDAERGGKQIFRESDVDALSDKHAGALDYLCDKAQELSRFRHIDIEAMTQNLPEGQSADSTTG